MKNTIKNLALAFWLGLLAVLPPLSLAQEKPQVLLFQSSHSAKAKTDLLIAAAENAGFDLQVGKLKGKDDEEVAQTWQRADLVLLDGINPALSKFMFHKYADLVKQHPDVKVVGIGDSDDSPMHNGLSAEVLTKVQSYYLNGGSQNYQRLMTYIDSSIFNVTGLTVLEPVIVPTTGLYHPEWPNRLSTDETAFFDWIAKRHDANQPVIAIGMHRSVIDYEQSQIVDALISEIEQLGGSALGYFFEDNEDSDVTYPELLTKEDGSANVQLLINYRSLHYAEKRKKEFASIGVPVIHALNYLDGDEAAFEADHAGISANMTPFFLVMPENSGSADPVLIAAKDEDGNKVVMRHQLSALAQRALNHGRLSLMDNADKKIATFIWNYPPGEKNIGAAFLDVPSSLAQITETLAEQGYQITTQEKQYFIDGAGRLLRPMYRNEDVAPLLEDDLADLLPLQTYLNWFDALPEFVTAPIVERWGTPQESSMLTERDGEAYYIIPRMQLGNMIVMPQGGRGEDASEHASLYHSTKTPINHGYLASYIYARQSFAADAFIHLGTHGSQEWLTGKERGLSVFDAPNLAVGNLPVFYPYIIDNVGEAMQAKRRGRATMISHLTPGFAKAGLYREISELNELLTNYTLLDEGQTQEQTRERIIASAKAQDILKDLQISEQQLLADFDGHIAKLQDYLHDMAQQSQPLGVHTFGQLPPQQHIVSTIIEMLGEDFVQLAAQFEAEQGWLMPEEERVDEQGVTKLQALDGYALLDRTLIQQQDVEVTEDLGELLALARTYWDNFHQTGELDSLVALLNGQFIDVGNGGDPIRNPQAVPTGKNLIGFNPAKVPSEEAYAAGVEVMNQTIDQYYQEHGRYPNKMAFSLWSLETMRHHGVLEAQILHAIGVKPKWNRQGNIEDIEIVSFEELGRPRIDVVLSATGLYRDAFPNVMLWLADAIDQVAQLKHEGNSIYDNSQQLKASLIAQGKSEEEANYLSTIRIFSNESGNYGTGLAASSLASDSWEDDSKLADLYMRRMGYFYGKDESRWSDKIDDVDLYGEVLSGTDAVVFSRSTNLYALLTNDDPFQYFGGVALAVRNLDGKTPEMFVSNLRRKDNVKAETMDAFLNKELRSRYFHPRWIEAMQNEGYAGALMILDRMNNFWGWEVMTPELVRDDQWQQFADIYVKDEYDMDMREFFEQHHPEALAQMIERMLEAERKDYWQTDEATLKELVETYTDLAQRYDIATQNKAFEEYLGQQAQGFGLDMAPALSVDTPAMSAPPSAATQQVQGQKLEQQAQQTDAPDNNDVWWMLAGLLAIFGVGMLSSFMPVSSARLQAA